ncbi:leucine-rich repeat-domain-containing protein [Bipolaris maydis]|nr:leucine-rich repeat-domain-containing protein [Bipolaris maydis]
MGAARDNDAIDLTDNDIGQLGNFPLHPASVPCSLPKTEFSNIQPSLSSSIPNLRTLVLTKNRIHRAGRSRSLGCFKSLTYLSLMGNPVTSKELLTRSRTTDTGVIWRCPSVRFLDFAKVRDVERKKAQELFGSFVVPTFANGPDSSKERIYTTTKERGWRAAILNASSPGGDGVSWRRILQKGRIPAHILEGGDPMET